MRKADTKFFRSQEYFALSANDKRDKLWEQVAAAAGTSGPWPNPAGLLVEGLDETFKTPGDVMPTNWITGLRTKYIHSVGVVGKVKLVLNGKNPYTGLF